MVAARSASDVFRRASQQSVPSSAVARLVHASDRLVRAEGRPIDFGGILAAITPQGAASMLVRVEGSESVVVAAYGLLASSFIGSRRPGAGVGSEPLASFSVSGRVVGVAVSPDHLAGVLPGVKAALAIRLTGQAGRTLGWLHLLDPVAERILEPEAVDLARLAAWQIGLAVENDSLLGRVEHERAEIERLTQQLAEASKLGAVGELAAAVAHEVNNPLTGIMGFAELLQSELPRDDPRRADAAVILAEAVRARTIVRALLEFARPRPPQRIPSALNELTCAALELARFRAQEAGVWIVEDYADLPSIELDPDACKQVLLNLFDNALDAMPHGGQMRVSTRRSGDCVGVVISDTGAGMDAETRKQIFTPFFSTRGPNRGGTGLGLSVSLQIVQGHGGTIEVESEPGEGATFAVWLPVSRPNYHGAVLVPGAGPGIEGRVEQAERPRKTRSAGPVGGAPARRRRAAA
jgi:signal transduction histidine kinase